MYRRHASFLFVAFLLTGCSSLPVSGGAGESFPAEQPGLSILDYSGTYVGREAYFAKFEVIDRMGVSLLYPVRKSDEEQVGPGSHHLKGRVPVFVQSQRNHYAPRGPGWLNARPDAVQSVTVLVVASDRPLNLEPFLESPVGISRALGETYTNWDQAVERILGIVVQNPAQADWEFDYRQVSVPRTWAIEG
jgi:hypothetical protein